MNGKIFTVRLSADENAVEILDQTLLPNRVEYLRLETAEQLYEAVFKLRVRGPGSENIGRYSAGAPQGGGVPRFVAANRSKSELGCKTNASLRGTRL